MITRLTVIRHHRTIKIERLTVLRNTMSSPIVTRFRTTNRFTFRVNRNVNRGKQAVNNKTNARSNGAINAKNGPLRRILRRKRIFTFFRRIRRGNITRLRRKLSHPVLNRHRNGTRKLRTDLNRPKNRRNTERFTLLNNSSVRPTTSTT